MSMARIYVSPLTPRVPTAKRQWDRGCRLTADSVEELHAFARRVLRLRPEWATRGEPGQLYYEISPGQRIAAVRAGAIDLGDMEIARSIGAGDVYMAGLFGAEGRAPRE